jgi:hypothetical protein
MAIAIPAILTICGYGNRTCHKKTTKDVEKKLLEMYIQVDKIRCN